MKLWTLDDFMHNPNHATLYGYNPSLIDCMSGVAGHVSFKNNKLMMGHLSCLFNSTVKGFPLELVQFVAIWSIYISIPFGGFAVLGLVSRFGNFTPKRIAKRREKFFSRWNKNNSNY
jgi:hypothetical protein